MKRKTSGSTMPLAKRLRRVERRVARNTPETKIATFTASGALADAAVSVTELKIGGASSQSYGAEAAKAKLLRVEILGTTGSEFADVYLIQGHTTTAPVYGDFNPTVGGYIKNEAFATNNQKYTVWKQFLNLGGGSNFRVTQSFKYGYNVHIDTVSNATVKNPLYLVVKNNTGGSINISYAARVWFVDA